MCNNNSFFAIPGADGLKIEKITDTSMIARPASVNMHRHINHPDNIRFNPEANLYLAISPHVHERSTLREDHVWISNTCHVHFIPFLVSLILEIDIILFIKLINILKKLCIKLYVLNYMQLYVLKIRLYYSIISCKK